MTLGRRCGERGRLWVRLLLVAAIVAILSAGIWVWRSPRTQVPTFRSPSAAERSQSEAARRLRAGAAGANLIIIVTDAAAAGHFTSFGYRRNATPNMSRFHEEGVLLTEAYSAGASTKPSIASLFTSQSPDTHGTLSVLSRLTGDGATLAECLKGAGYRTAGFSASPSVSAAFGFSRGFDFFHELFREVGLEPVGPGPRNTGGTPVDGALVLRSALRWIRGHENERFFTYLHFREPHSPYGAPPSFHADFADSESTERGVSALLYDTGLAYVDSLVGKLLKELDARGLLDKSVVVLLADHGEAFGEHGRFGHNSTAYREMMRVPLAFHLPSGCGVAPRRRSEVFSTTDLMPTLLDLFQIPPPETMQGRSRLALLAGEEEETAGFAVSRALGEDRTGGKQKPEEVSYALRVPRYTLLLADRGRRVELYDREADPGELNDIAGERPEVVKKLQAQFAAWADSQRGRPVVLPGGRVFAVVGKESDIDDTTRRQLKSLGYLK